MKGLAIIEADVVEKWQTQLSQMSEMFQETAKSLKEAKKPWMTVQETAEYMSKSVSWVYQNKKLLGFSKPGADILFSRKKIDDYLWSVFFQSSPK